MSNANPITRSEVTTGTEGSLTPSHIALASLVGTTIEWYDFFIYGTAAALVFSRQFFPSMSPVAGTLAALATFAVGFVARPLGGALMGHLGDRIGRKRMLVFSLLSMGGATALVGVLPTYHSIGLAAPLLLVVLRIVQGLGVGGEWGGAVLMSLEHAPPSRRTLYASFPQLGLPVGIILANLSFLVLRLLVDDAAFQAWGWRILFLASAVLIAVGMFLRSRVGESPEFARMRRRNEVMRVPIVELFKTMPVSVLQAAGVSVLFSALGNIVFVYTLSYAAHHKLASSSTVLGFTIAAAVISILGTFVGARMAARFGQRRILLVTLALCVAWAFPHFLLVGSGSTAMIGLACVVGGWLQAVGYGPLAAFVADAFPARIRYTGASVAYGIGGVAGGAIAPIVATALVAASGTTLLVSVYLVAIAGISILATATLRSPRTQSTLPA